MSDKDMPQDADNRYQAPTLGDMVRAIPRNLPMLAWAAAFGAITYAGIWLVDYVTGDHALATLVQNSVWPIILGGMALCAVVAGLRTNARDVGFDASIDITRAHAHAFGMLLMMCVLAGLSIYTYLNA